MAWKHVALIASHTCRGPSAGKTRKLFQIGSVPGSMKISIVASECLI